MGAPIPLPIRILLIEDHTIVRAALHMLLENSPGLRVVGETASRSEALSLAAHEQPDVILLDLDLGGSSGLDLLPELLAVASSARVLILTGVRDPEQHRQAVRLGAVGLVLKERSTEILLKAIEKVHAGEVWLGRTVVRTRRSEEAPKNYI